MRCTHLLVAVLTAAVCWSVFLYVFRSIHIKNGTPASANRTVIVENMCRCGPHRCPIKGTSLHTHPAGVTQAASLATGAPRTFYVNVRECVCADGPCNVFVDGILRGVEERYAFAVASPARRKAWHNIPDFGREQHVPVFVGALSFKTPQSLDAGLHNWNRTFFAPSVISQFQGAFIHLNGRSQRDDAVVAPFAAHWTQQGLPVHVTGSGDVNDNVGKVIADQCRLAEQSSASHPNGENIMLWLEKDWHWNLDEHGLNIINNIINSSRELLQHGVVKLNLRPPPLTPTLGWPCAGQEVLWRCAPGFLFHNMNSPMLLRCDWFLRYFEPDALYNNDAILAYGRTGHKRAYFDWEEAGQDGRIEWVNSHWILGASVVDGLFSHVEVNETDMYKRRV